MPPESSNCGLQFSSGVRTDSPRAEPRTNARANTDQEQTESHYRTGKRWSDVQPSKNFAPTKRRDCRRQIASRSRLRRPSLSRHDKEITVRKPITSFVPGANKQRPRRRFAANDSPPRHKRPT